MQVQIGAVLCRRPKIKVDGYWYAIVFLTYCAGGFYFRTEWLSDLSDGAVGSVTAWP